MVSSSEPQREPNAILEIYNLFLNRLTFLNRHMKTLTAVTAHIATF